MQFRLSGKADWLRVVNYVRTLTWKRDDKQVMYRLSIEEVKPTRSLEQNSRYWALVTAISQQAPEHMGGEWHDPESWHMYCRRRFLGMEAGPFGEGVPKSTRGLKVGEFCDYMTAIEAWAIDQFDGFNFEWREAA